MIRHVLIFIFLLSSAASFAQRPESDSFKTNMGSLTVQPILHGTLALQVKDQTIYIDPYGGAAAFEGIDKPDLILITDIHGDHLNISTLDALETKDVKIVVPQAVADKISEKYKDQLVIISNGETTKQLDVDILATPMYNLPESPDSRHVKGRGNGYIIEIGDLRVYISGDTSDIQEMRELKNIDIAFVCMNLPYTMNIEQAASAVLDFKPKIVYPFHYRGKPGLSDTEAFKKLVNDKNADIEVRLRNWYPEYQ